MPTLRRESTVDLHYDVDDFTDPWTTPETVLMLHGNAETGAVWFGWVPHLARHFRVVRPDMRGFGRSTPMPESYPWTLDALIDDCLALMRTLGVERFHLVGAKLGGTIARRFAARCPDQVLTLTVAGTPAPRRAQTTASTPGWQQEFIEHGTVSWARRTMAGRLGAGFPEAGVAWWIELMGRTAVSTQLGFVETIAVADITADLPAIRCPTLVITTEGSALGSVEETRAWQRMIARSELLVLPGNSYHVAASEADRCAMATREFILRERTSRAT
ncbi:MAG: alpha/beta hydrolase [Proteobacteria bacterium]|nr:alpha/beta hydrolase [Burkholderiales bacterium]